jgi:Ca-activated chloride channel family protein
MTEFRVANPSWLLLLIPLLALTIWSIRQRRRAAILYSSVQLIRNLPVTLAQRFKRCLPWIRCLALLLVVVALARPQWGLTEFRVRTEGIAIMMCLDRSGSMMAMDFELGQERVNRLAAVKDVFRKFVIGDRSLPGRTDDLVGLVSFGGFAEAKAPLTLDHGALLEMLDTVEIAKPILDDAGRTVNERFLREEQATAIGDALALAVDRLRDAEAKSKVVILISDGENTAGVTQPDEAARAAESFGVKVYSIGVGTTGRAPFLMTDSFGRRVLVPQLVRLDEATLKLVAETTGGQYFAARDTAALETVYGEIDKLEKTPSEGRLFTQYRELFQWLLLPGIALILCETLLRGTRFRELP